MEDWSKKPDDLVFKSAGEQPGSQASYWRELEIKRRLFELQRQALKAQIDATKAQREAIEEMRNQSRIMFWSVIGIFATAIVTFIVALL